MSRLLAVARRHPRSTAAAASVLLVGVFDVTVRLTTEPDASAAPPATTPPTSTTTTTTSTTSSTTTSAPPTTPPVAAAPAPAPATAPATIAATAPPTSPGWPTAATTGVGSTAGLTEWTDGCVIDTPNQVIEDKVFDCAVDIVAPGVTIRSSLVRSDDDWGISVEAEGAPAVIENVTIEATSGCNAFGSAIAFSGYHASRVKVLNFGTAFVFGGNDTVVRDSYAKLCAPPGSEADGVGLDGYDALDATPQRPNIFDHNTIDQRCADWRSALRDPAHPGSGNAVDQACDSFAVVSWWESGNGLQLTDNLLRGGAYAIAIGSGSGHEVTGNVVERASYAYDPIDECLGVATDSGNREADVGAGGAISNETTLACDG